MKKIFKFILAMLIAVVGGVFAGTILQRDEDVNPLPKAQDQFTDNRVIVLSRGAATLIKPLEKFTISARIVDGADKHYYLSSGSAVALIGLAVISATEHILDSQEKLY